MCVCVCINNTIQYNTNTIPIILMQYSTIHIVSVMYYYWYKYTDILIYNRNTIQWYNVYSILMQCVW